MGKFTNTTVYNTINSITQGTIDRMKNPIQSEQQKSKVISIDYNLIWMKPLE